MTKCFYWSKSIKVLVGEHGDGRNRGHRLRDYFGEEVYQCLKDVKNIFDPAHIMNPGIIIIDVPPMDKTCVTVRVTKIKKTILSTITAMIIHLKPLTA
ncbi:MAG: hypothetical protein IPI53_10330 [Saprospiraceae bacterium]|nr:hypothetical protein [Saprospiraceae bacterium]